MSRRLFSLCIVFIMSFHVFSAEEWVSDKTYSAGDTVLYNGSIFVAEREVTLNTPPVDTDQGWFWVAPTTTPPQNNATYHNVTVLENLDVDGLSSFNGGITSNSNVDIMGDLNVKGEILLSVSTSSGVKKTQIVSDNVKIMRTTITPTSAKTLTTDISPGIINLETTNNLGNKSVRLDASGLVCGNGDDKTTISEDKVHSTLVESDEVQSQKVVCGELIVTDDAWADYVFKREYQLKSLTEVKDFININGHLPGIPSEAEVKNNGVSVGEMQVKLLEKIEEMTLYMIALEKKVAALEAERK